MEIILPGIAQKYDDWSDREKVVLSLFFYFYTLDRHKDTRYFISSHDIKRILGITASANPVIHLEKLRRAFRIGIVSWEIWSFELLYDKETVSKNGVLLSYTDDIQDTQAIQLFSYLGGRLTLPDIITDGSRGIPKLDTREMRLRPLMGQHFAHSILGNEI